MGKREIWILRATGGSQSIYGVYPSAEEAEHARVATGCVSSLYTDGPYVKNTSVLGHSDNAVQRGEMKRAFWEAIYIAAVRAGCDPPTARDRANHAVLDGYRERFSPED